jgi:TRAP-type C4-dicarboxylate transport system permease small subunit
MNTIKLLGLVILVSGILGLMYGSFSYTKNTEEAKIGSLAISVKDKQTFNIPVWMGVGGIVLGSAFLVTGYRGRAA